MTRRRLTDRQRAKIFMDAGGVCHCCGEKIGEFEAWDVEHVIPLSMGGDDDFHNMRPAHRRKCHPEKTRQDRKDLAKSDSVRAKHIGAHQPKRRINPRAVRQCDVPISEKMDWRSRKEARQNGGGDDA